ncbi:MAG: LCP family protein [Meiothermus sp.]|uniref:LCP family protein n=1 Tax=Meiothermus sp. TaxID=1955249 RepID=UPI0025E4AC7D|nr:LCP family protein [Meiothermus sp.]MCS7058872.1 LCP family protein [Meiothermus sp.]MCS7194902.1 LCP family protein [Meiothermus sp.]MCX7741602.1 LCP family protein [Meiothermus sp.]MDW8091289.1 LCP family protein [Meiothermus sp.]MDW8482531.1 LCP family protein [Meiothermus sp.]
MRRFVLWGFLLALVGVGWWAYPLLQPLLRYGALPRKLNEPLNVLVLGVAPEYKYYHQRAPENFRGLSDVNLLVRFDPRAHRISVLSIPRDVYVQIPGYGWHIINHANKLGGPELAKAVVQNLTGVGVDAYVAVSVDAIRSGVDALGGLEVCVEKTMRYRDTAARLEINLEPGCQRLNGVQAEGYLRFRHDPLGDIGRIQRQQNFFNALKQQLLSPAGLLRLPQALAQVEPHIRTDLTREEIGALLGFLATRPELVSLLTPGQFGRGWEVNREELRRLVERYFSDAAPAETARDLRGRLAVVLYAAPQEAQATDLRNRLRELGLRVLLREVESPPPKSEVLTNGEAGLAQALGEALGLPYRVSGEAALYSDLTVRLGTDLSKPDEAQ